MWSTSTGTSATRHRTRLNERCEIGWQVRINRMHISILVMVRWDAATVVARSIHVKHCSMSKSLFESQVNTMKRIWLYCICDICGSKIYKSTCSGGCDMSSKRCTWSYVLSPLLWRVSVVYVRRYSTNVCKHTSLYIWLYGRVVPISTSLPKLDKS